MSVIVSSQYNAVLKCFEFLNLPVFIINDDWEIVSFNYLALNIFGYSEEDLLNKNITDFMSLGHSKIQDIFYATRLYQGSNNMPTLHTGLRFETLARNKHKDNFPANITIIPFIEEKRIIVTIQDISGLKKLSKRATQRTKELQVFTTFAKIIAKQTNTDRIMQETISMLLTHLDAQKGWIYLYSEEHNELHLVAQRGFEIPEVNDISCLSVGECLAGKVFNSGRALLSERIANDPRVKHRIQGIECMTAVPLSSRGTLLGVLCLGSKGGGHFTSMDIQLLNTIGSQLGVALENAMLIEELQKKMQQIKLINEVSSVINSNLSIGSVFRIMVAELKRLIDYDRASLLLFDEQKNNLTIFALDTDMKTIMTKGVKAPIEGTSAGWVIKNNKPWINYDLLNDVTFYLDKKLSSEGIRSTISIPLFQDRLLGVFNLDSVFPSKYSEKDYDILLPVAKHISIALENALLFEQISKEKREWEKTFDALTDMVWIVDNQGKALRSNESLRRLLGSNQQNLLNMKSEQIFEKIGLNYQLISDNTRINDSKEYFYELKGRDGSTYHYWTYPLMEEGRCYASVNYLRDVTSRKRLEQQLIRTDRLASLGTLAAGIAHEINNPLGIIAGYSEALIERTKYEIFSQIEELEDFPEYLQTIHNEIFRCKDILKTLLDFARPAVRISRDIDINEIIKEVMLLATHSTNKYKQRFTLDLDREIPKVHGEPGALRQLFMNIIINSIYYTSKTGHINIKTWQEKKDDAAHTNIHRRLVCISIKDTGPGIEPSIIDRIFDPFFTTKPVGEGTGLGLSICHKIVEEHEGEIYVESVPSEKTIFYIKLPAKETP